MPSSPSSLIRAELQALGENLNSWGDTRLNEALKRLEEASHDFQAISLTATLTLSVANYVADQARARGLIVTGSLSVSVDIVVPALDHHYVVDNQTTGISPRMRVAGQTGYQLRPGPQHVYVDGTDVRRADARLDQLPLPTSAVDINGVTVSNVAALSMSGGLTVGGGLSVSGTPYFGGQPLKNVGAPVSVSDAATKAYVDAQAFAAALPASTNGFVAAFTGGAWGGVSLGAAGIAGLAANTFTGAQNLGGQQLQAAEVRDFRYTKRALGSLSATQTLDVQTAGVFEARSAGNITWAFANVPSVSVAVAFVLELTNGGANTQTWPAAVAWDGGPAPTLQSSGVDVLGFLTDDGGAVWRGYRVWRTA